MSESLSTQLAGILRISTKPVALDRAIAGWSDINETEFDADQATLAELLCEGGPAGPLRKVLRERLAHWDHVQESEADWAGKTPPNSEARRLRVYELLDLAPPLHDAVVDLLPPHLTDERNIVITRDGWKPWYTGERRIESRFYWGDYSRYLLDVREWDPDNVEALDEATSLVVERLADPRDEANRATRGMVVGHVQSGKTANLTGVIAKAADAGYRLIIVLSGTTDLLRNQTQRRIDKELVGKELIRPKNVDPSDQVDYQNDADWDDFIEHGGRPSEQAAFDWIRLTGEEWDYRRLKAGIETLEFGRLDSSRPFFAPENLQHAPAKIMVIKKQSQRLNNVLQDLRRITTRLADVPALIIDDESDQASINTARPATKADERRRTRINELIVELLQTLPRAQYVGYTATPFANVLIDARDEVDLFPRDFIISLRAPRNYMGARAFHDLDGEPPGVEDDRYRSNEFAFLRPVGGIDEAPDNLPRAIDSFVLAGALKLFRAEKGVKLSTRHHTMLIHSSRLTREHAVLRSLAASLFDQAEYETAGGATRLEALLTKDFAPVAASREPGLPFPSTWAELRPFVGAAIARIRNGEGPVIVVNGTNESEDPDFDRQSIWKILVGGAKLSRGYTIEGLTTSYFRRRATTGDALMQMGRWFGYRENYLDLVRLFMSREEQAGSSGRKYDLYEGFEAVCRDEEAFRAQLQRYAVPEDESQVPLTPLQVPPLVYSHLQWLPPVAKNKRTNATMTWENYGGRWAEPTMAPIEADRIVANSELFADLLSEHALEQRELTTGTQTFAAVTTSVAPPAMLGLLESYRWAESFQPATRIIEFLRGSGEKDPGIDRWVVIAPQLRQASRVPDWTAGDTSFTVKYRARVSQDGIRVKAYSEPVHREVAKLIAIDRAGPADLAGERTGVMLFYPAHHIAATASAPDDLIPTMGFALLSPANGMRQQAVFVTREDDARPFIDA